MKLRVFSVFILIKTKVSQSNDQQQHMRIQSRGLKKREAGDYKELLFKVKTVRINIFLPKEVSTSNTGV